MKYLDNAAFKEAVKTNKSIRSPLRKTIIGKPVLTGDRQIKFTFSTPTVDRDYDLISQEGIDLTWYQTNPLVFFGHEHDSLPIGKCVSIGIENGNLTGVIEFAPVDNPGVGAKAEGIFQLCKDGFLSCVSIGFIPMDIDYPKDQTRYNNDGVDIKTCEMVEVSIVGIPSNRSALIQEISTPADASIEVIDQPEPTKNYRGARLKRIIDSMTLPEMAAD